ncbi:MAG: flippase-like domain-containing protein [Planctomycetes bacterium]|nr:flippase-like domain-containing protein [Planctomycetota bacterium]
MNETIAIDGITGPYKPHARGLGRFGTLLAGIGICMSIVLVIAIVGDMQEISGFWGAFRWESLILIGLLAVANQGLRYWRWEILLKKVAPSAPVKRTTAMIAFGAGSLLIFTPARIGEVAKSIYAQRFFDIPVSKSVSVLIAERLADMVVMALLAILGLLLLGDFSHLVMALSLFLSAVAIFIIWGLSLKWRIISRIVRKCLGAKLDQVIHLASSSQRLILTPRIVGINLVLGGISWLTEVLIYFLSLWAIGISPDLHLFVIALAVFPLASLGGSLSFLPGGLGATEGGLVALGILLGGLAEETALVASLISRIAILGIVVLAGFASIFLLNKIASGSEYNQCHETG